MIDPASRAVVDIARTILAGSDLDEILDELLSAASALTGARYAALGVLDDGRAELARFVTRGIDADEAREIGPLPRGHGVLGELIRNPVPLRLADVSLHPHSYGFPLGHPIMKTFLGVPIFIDGVPYGNLYLTEKANGEEFDADDEEAVVLLAEFAGVAIDHARRLGSSEERRERLQRAVDALDATVTIARTLAAQTDLRTVLDLVAKRGRALVDARVLVIELMRDGELEVAAAAGQRPPGLLGQRISDEDSLAAVALRTAETQNLESQANRTRYLHHGLGRHGLDAEGGLIVPLLLRGQTYGALVALDRLEGGPHFGGHDQELLEAFATSAGIAVATAQVVGTEHREQRIAAAERERARWAHELHAETLQGLAALRVSFTRIGDAEPARMRGMLEGADRQVAEEMAKLRDLIGGLRPAALDEDGLEPALRALVDGHRAPGVDVRLRLDLTGDDRLTRRLDPELETGIYRIAQEALSNAVNHGSPGQVTAAVNRDEVEVTIAVTDDGDGFDPAAASDGSGLRVMRERVELLAGTIAIDSAPGEGTRIRAVLPALPESVGGARASSA